MKINMATIQKQRGLNDCGLFSIANDCGLFSIANAVELAKTS